MAFAQPPIQQPNHVVLGVNGLPTNEHGSAVVKQDAAERNGIATNTGRMEALEMKGKLALSAASWLSKPENREKVKRTVREFRSRVAKDEGVQESRPEQPSPERSSTPERSSPQHGSGPEHGSSAERGSRQNPEPPRPERGDSAGHGRPQS